MGISKNSDLPFSFGEGGGIEVIKGKVFRDAHELILANVRTDQLLF